MELIEMIGGTGLGFRPILAASETNKPNEVGVIMRTIRGEGIIGI